MYSVLENGRYSKVVPDVLDIPFNDLVSFYIGCSYSFEYALRTSGLPLRHIESGCNVPGYITDIPCHSAGPFAANLVVTMRPFPRRLVEKAVDATADLHLVHGAPIHIGDPRWIGIKDFAHPDFDDAPVNEDGDVCLFWACGTSAALALRDASTFVNLITLVHFKKVTSVFHVCVILLTKNCVMTLLVGMFWALSATQTVKVLIKTQI